MQFWLNAFLDIRNAECDVDDQVSGRGTDHLYPAHAPTIIASAMISFCSS